MTNPHREVLGPLADLIGVWQGDKGDDLAPSHSRGSQQNAYREVMTFEPMGPIQNHEQNLHVLRYSTRAWRLGEPTTFHEELGYWSWEPSTQEVMRCFLIPRGISLIAGGKAAKSDSQFTLKAERGSCTFGICTNPFLDREFQIVAYEMKFEMLGPDSFAYEQDTVLQLPKRPDLFHHVDKNTLTRVVG